MAQSIILGAVSASSSVQDRKDAFRSYQWYSVRAFVTVGQAFVAANLTFSTYLNDNRSADSIFTYFLVLITIGMPYMHMDFFIKQYTGKIDMMENLNPFLKGVTFGAIWASSLYCLIHGSDLASSISFLIGALTPTPPWSDCSKYLLKQSKQCFPTKMIYLGCPDKINTSTHLYYKYQFEVMDRTVISKKIFLVAVVWITTFFLSTLADHAIIKIFNLTFIINVAYTVVSTVYVLAHGSEYFQNATHDLFKVELKDVDYRLLTNSQLYQFGPGLVGVYDFGTMSPYTVIETAIVLYAIVNFVILYARILMLKILSYAVVECADFDTHNYHKLLFLLTPLAIENMPLSRLFHICFFLNLVVSLTCHMTALTATITRTLHSEFRKVKLVYLSGLACFIGLSGTIPIAIEHTISRALLDGLYYSVTFVSMLKTAIIVYVYGVQRFSTDIHFWLNYKPSRYWQIFWSFLPLLFGYHVYEHFTDIFKMTWFKSYPVYSITLVIVPVTLFIIIAAGMITTTIKYILADKIGSLMRSNPRYGPPDADERRRRKRYDAALSVRTCNHKCVIIDDKFDCNHAETVQMLVMPDEVTAADKTSVLQLFEGGKARMSEMMDINLPN